MGRSPTKITSFQNPSFLLSLSYQYCFCSNEHSKTKCGLISLIHYNAMFGFVATPEPRPTRMASPNQNPGDARLILFIFCVIKFSFSKVSQPDSPARPEWRIRTGSRFTPTFSFILSKHFIMSFCCGSRFSFGQAHNHLQIQCNSVGS